MIGLAVMNHCLKPFEKLVKVSEYFTTRVYLRKLGNEKFVAQRLYINSNSKNTNRITPNAAAIAVDAAYAQPIVFPRGESCHYDM